MNPRLKAANRYVLAIETALAGGLTATVFVVVLSQVLLRYLFAQPSPWSEELSRFCLVWLAMLGAAIAVERRSHFAFEAVVDRLPVPMRRVLGIMARAVLALVAFVLVVGGLLLVELTLGQRSPAIGYPVALVYGAVPTAGALMLLHLSSEETDDG